MPYHYADHADYIANTDTCAFGACGERHDIKSLDSNWGCCPRHGWAHFMNEITRITGLGVNDSGLKREGLPACRLVTREGVSLCVLWLDGDGNACCEAHGRVLRMRSIESAYQAAVAALL